MTYWMQTFTGKTIDLENPTPDGVDIIDIAHSLSMTCRFGGHSISFYSVAEHSLLVEKLGSENPEDNSRTPDPKQTMALLLHDSAEAYIGDIITPLKTILHKEICHLETLWLSSIQKRFDIGNMLTDQNPIIKHADRLALSIEVIRLLRPCDKWCEVFDRPTDDQMRNTFYMGWTPEKAKFEFLSRFVQIRQTLNQQANERQQ